MAIKITSRFAPSVVRAAHVVEAALAASNVGFDSKLRASAHRVVMSTVDTYSGIAKRAGNATAFGAEVEACMGELKAERKRQAQERRARKLAREREKEMLIAQGAFA